MRHHRQRRLPRTISRSRISGIVAYGNQGERMDVVSEIHAWNRGRELQRLRLKYAKMETDAFSFFRGTAHLFFRDWPRDTALDDAPLVWVCGDLHLENFGSFRGD